METLRIETTIRAPIERCFDAARDLDLHVESLAHTNEIAVAGRTSGLIELGEEVTWRGRHFGIVQHFTSRITAFERPFYFAAVAHHSCGNSQTGSRTLRISQRVQNLCAPSASHGSRTQTMRRALIYSALLLLCCSSLRAADAGSGDRWRLSILASEISSPSDNDRTFAGLSYSDDVHAGVSLGVAYAPTPQWDVELTAASQTHISPYTRLFYSPGPTGAPGFIYPSTEFRRYRVMPLDVSVTRHFRADQVIAPYLRAGVRHVSAPDDPTPSTSVIGPFEPGGPVLFPVTEGFGLSDRLSTQAGAGVRVRLTPRTAVRAEVNRLLRSEGADFDPLTRYAVGLSWLF